VRKRDEETEKGQTLVERETGIQRAREKQEETGDEKSREKQTMKRCS